MFSRRNAVHACALWGLLSLFPAGATAQTVGDEVGGGGCSTAVVRGLADQLVGQLNCLYPDTLENFDDGGQIEFASGAVLGALQPGAIDGLMAALGDRAGSTITITSALRSLPQQYLLYQWYQAGRCGIQIAASPGRSNHEGGLAIDVSNHDAWRNALENHGWEWYGSGDVVHFTYVAAGEDIRSASVLSFQTLWNANHPNDTIDEDGLYGPQTEARLGRSPVDGFEIATTCNPCAQGLHARFDSVQAPPEAYVGTEVSIAASFTNTGDATWVAGQVSLATNPPVALGADVIDGGSTTLTYSFVPAAQGPVTIALGLVDAGGAPIPAGCEGSPTGEATVNVLPAADPPDDPAEPDDGYDEQPDDPAPDDGDDLGDPAFDGTDSTGDAGRSVGLAGGCSMSGGAPDRSWAVLILMGLGGVLSRSRRS